MNEQVSGALFKRMVLHGAASITLEKQAINDLNVFPVPDGDTGTNMSMTIATAVTELKKIEPDTLDQAASVTASALLRGARGNSGVILSLLFRGIARSSRAAPLPTPRPFAAAMQEGVSSAYKAVMKPAEGTVLTVSRLAAKRAVETAAAEKDVEKVLENAIQEGHAALEQTIEMNPVLKKAGVVDAGGKGFLVILEGMLAEMRGEPVPEAGEAPAPKRNGRISTSFPPRRSPSPSTRSLSSASPAPPFRWSRCASIWAASETAWSSARTTRPSRSTCIPTSPAAP
jgi:dihydroxyacetone kinase-like predicted kinase